MMLALEARWRIRSNDCYSIWSLDTSLLVTGWIYPKLEDFEHYIGTPLDRHDFGK
jgi:hypothetical protein